VVESELNDKGFIRTTLSIDRIEVLAGPAVPLTLDKPATASPSVPRPQAAAAPVAHTKAEAAAAANDDDPLPF
jgi:hypothetical protein